MPTLFPNPRHRRSPKNLTLNDAFPDWDDGLGIFSLLAATTETPWTTDSPVGLDIAYHGQRSGNKFIAPMLYRWIDENAALSATGIEKVMLAIQSRYYQKWKHLWSVYTTQYSPLDSYNLRETGSNSGSHSESGTDTRTPNLTKADTYSETSSRDGTRTPDITTKDVLDEDMTTKQDGSGSTTYGHVITDNGTSNQTTDNKTFGFNSSAAVNTNQSTTNSTNTNTQTHSGQDSNTNALTGTDTHDSTNTRTETGTEKNEETGKRDYTNEHKETGTDTMQKSSSGTESGEYTRTRVGNMYRSPAELLQLDREFWMDDFFSIVFRDMDELLTLAVYSEADPRVKVF